MAHERPSAVVTDRHPARRGVRVGERVAVGEGDDGGPSPRVPLHRGRGPVGVVATDDPAEGVAGVAGGVAGLVDDLRDPAGGVVAAPHRVAERVGGGDQAALVVVVEAPRRPRRVVDEGQHAQAAVGEVPLGAARCGQAHQPFQVVVGELDRGADGVDDPVDGAVGAVLERRLPVVGVDQPGQAPRRRPLDGELAARRGPQGHEPPGRVAVERVDRAVGLDHPGRQPRRVELGGHRRAEPVGGGDHVPVGVVGEVDA